MANGTNGAANKKADAVVTVRVSCVDAARCPFVNGRVEFSLARGGVVWLTGPSGVGKSTVAAEVAGLGARDPPPLPGLELTTAAQAEGSIEGTWQDYRVTSRYANDFKFSRLGLAFARPRDVASLTGWKFASARAPPMASSPHWKYTRRGTSV